MPITNPWMLQMSGYDGPDYASILADSTYIPGQGYIQNDRFQQDQRGAWIGGAMPYAGGPATPGQPSLPPGGGYAPALPGPDMGADTGRNPYLGDMADDIQRRTTDMLGQAFQGIQSNSVATGGLGGSRQAIAQGLAGAKAADYMSGQLANMYGTDWTNFQNRELQRTSMDNSFFLGNRGLDLNQVQAGANMYGMGNQGWLSQGQGLYGLGTTTQQAPWQLVSQFGSGISPFTGLGVQTQTSSNAGPGGILGGALAGAQLGRLMFPNSNTYGGGGITGGGGFGTGANFGNQDYGLYI